MQRSVRLFDLTVELGYMRQTNFVKLFALVFAGEGRGEETGNSSMERISMIGCGKDKLKVTFFEII